jgi:hypothetical protein
VNAKVYSDAPPLTRSEIEIKKLAFDVATPRLSGYLHTYRERSRPKKKSPVEPIVVELVYERILI